MVGQFQPVGVESKLVQHSGVKVGDVMPVLDGVEAEFIGCAMGKTALNAAAGEPYAEAVGMMVAPLTALGAGGAAELGAPHD